MSFDSRCKDLFSPLHLKQRTNLRMTYQQNRAVSPCPLPRTSHPPPAGSRDGRTWPPTPPPSQRAAADPGPKHGENPVPCKETKPEIKIVRNTAFTTTTSLPTRETQSPPPWPTRSSPPSAAPASHETPETYEARGRTLPPQCSPPPPPRAWPQEYFCLKWLGPSENYSCSLSFFYI